jgi:hypothetical protein
MYTPDIVPRTANLTFESINLKGIIEGNSEVVAWWMGVDSTITTTDTFRNINVSVIDKTTSVTANNRLLRFVSMNGANTKAENIRFKDVYTSRDIYLGSKIAATFELDNVNANILYYDNGTLLGVTGAEKIYIRNSELAQLLVTSTSYGSNASLFLDYVKTSLQLSHLDTFASFDIQTRARKRGTSTQRPFINTNFVNKGSCMQGVPFTYYDTTLNKLIMVSNTSNVWINLDGSAT